MSKIKFTYSKNGVKKYLSGVQYVEAPEQDFPNKGDFIKEGLAEGAASGNPAGIAKELLVGGIGELVNLATYKKKERLLHDRQDFASNQNLAIDAQRNMDVNAAFQSKRFGNNTEFIAEDGLIVPTDLINSGKKLIEVEKDELIYRRLGGITKLVADYQDGKRHDEGGEDYIATEGDIIFPGKMREEILKITDPSSGVVNDMLTFNMEASKLPKDGKDKAAAGAIVKLIGEGLDIGGDLVNTISRASNTGDGAVANRRHQTAEKVGSVIEKTGEVTSNIGSVMMGAGLTGGASGAVSGSGAGSSLGNLLGGGTEGMDMSNLIGSDAAGAVGDSSTSSAMDAMKTINKFKPSNDGKDNKTNNPSLSSFGPGGGSMPTANDFLDIFNYSTHANKVGSSINPNDNLFAKNGMIVGKQRYGGGGTVGNPFGEPTMYIPDDGSPRSFVPAQYNNGFVASQVGDPLIQNYLGTNKPVDSSISNPPVTYTSNGPVSNNDGKTKGEQFLESAGTGLPILANLASAALTMEKGKPEFRRSNLFTPKHLTSIDTGDPLRQASLNSTLVSKANRRNASAGNVNDYVSGLNFDQLQHLSNLAKINADQAANFQNIQNQNVQIDNQAENFNVQRRNADLDINDANRAAARNITRQGKANLADAIQQSKKDYAIMTRDKKLEEENKRSNKLKSQAEQNRINYINETNKIQREYDKKVLEMLGIIYPQAGMNLNDFMIFED